VLRPAAESALREWTVDQRVNRTGEGDDDPTIVEPLVKVVRVATRDHDRPDFVGYWQRHKAA